MIQWQIERLSNCKSIDKLIVATSNETTDEPLAELCRFIDTPVFKGSLDNVLERFFKLAQSYKPKFIVRLTGDCPLIDSTLVDQVIEFMRLGTYDYVSNSQPPTFPDGLDVEVFTFDALKIIYENAKLESEKEHVTLYIANNPEKFKIGTYKNPIDLSHHRWTVDEQADFEFVTAIFEQLAHVKNNFLMDDILKILENNQTLISINSDISRNEGLIKSLCKDNP